MISYFRSPLGWIRLEQRGAALVSLDFVPKKPAQGRLLERSSAVWRELTEYFERKRKKFSFKTPLQGTSFQNRVWKTLKSLPYGRTVSYAQIAARIGKKNAVRAVRAEIKIQKFVDGLDAAERQLLRLFIKLGIFNGDDRLLGK